MAWVLLFAGLFVFSARATWVERYPDVSHSLNGAAFGNNTFVAVGDYGEITRSTDFGENWDETQSGGDHFFAVAYGNGTFVAVGKNGRVSRSTDGATWVDETPVSGSVDLNGIAYGNGTFVAVGDGGNICRSGNGASWTSVTINANDLNGIAFGNGWFVAVGDYGHIHRSNDNGSSWETIEYSGADLHAVAFGNNTFVTAGSYAYRSTDNGASWDSLALDHVKNGVAFGDNRFIICGSYGVIFESDPGSSTVWNSIDTGASSFYAATFGNHVFVAAGLLRTLYTEGTAATGISPASANVAVGGGSETVSVSAPGGFVWTASSAYSWIHVISGSTGSGNGTVTYDVDSNPLASSRDGTVQVAGFTHSVHQAANTYPTAISPMSVSFQQAGGPGTINVTAQVGRGWTATPSAPWISIVSGSPGSGVGSVDYDVAANTSGSARNGTITIDGQVLSISQGTGSLSISPVSKRFYYTGGTGSFDIDTYAGDIWTPVPGETWISITSYGGNGPGPVNYSVAENDTGYFRTGEITVDGAIYTVEQEGRFPYIINPSTTAFGSGGGNKRVTLSTNPSGRPWTAASDSSWLQITSATNGTGSGYFDVRVLVNESVSNRFGRVRIGDSQYFVDYVADQSGATAYYSISPTGASFPGSGGTKSVTITATDGAGWTATSPVGWVTLSSGSGIGNGVVSYTVDPNSTTNARSAVLTIAGKSHTVSQASGDTPSYCWVDPSSIRENLPGGTTVGTLQIESYLPVASPLFTLPAGYADGSAFSISNDLLLSSAPFDAETKDTYLPGILAENGHGGSWEGQIAVSVDDDTMEDADGDGLPEEDEIVQGLEDTVVDADGDGISDGDEVRIAGTDPLDPLSCLRFTQINHGCADWIDMQWIGGTGKTCRVLASDSLPDGFPYVIGEATNGFFSCQAGSYAHRFFRLAAAAPVVQQEAKLLTFDGVNDDRFGVATGISGNTLVVGAKFDDDKGSSSGSAYVYEYSAASNHWNFVTKLTASDGAVNDEFGYAVAIDGDTIAVGSKKDDSARGAVYIFERDAGGADQWGQVKKITASDSQTSDYFGYRVVLDGDRLAVGSGHGDSRQGAAYLFERNSGGTGNWGEVKKLTTPNGQLDDQFGWSIALSGNTAAVGAYEDDDSGTDAGAVYLFERDAGGAGAWGQTHKLFGMGIAAWDKFGIALDLDGDTLAVGAPQDNERAYHAGAAYIFERDRDGADQWGQTRKVRFAEGGSWNLFGNALDLEGDNLAVGAWNAYNADGIKSGTAFLFQRDLNGTDRWGLLQRFAPGDPAEGQSFGGSISISGDTILTGAAGDDTTAENAGAAYVHKMKLP